MTRQNITFALFDVRPVDPRINRVNFDFINSLSPVVNLSDLSKPKRVILKETSEYSILPVHPVKSSLKEFDGVKSASAPQNGKQEILQELQATLSQNFDFNKELKLFGGKLVDSTVNVWPRRAALVSRDKNRPDFDYIVKENKNLEKFRKEFSKIFFSYAAEESGPPAKAKLLAAPPYLPWGPEIGRLKPQAILDLSPAARELDLILDHFRNSQTVALYPAAAALPQKTYEEKTSKFLLYFTLGITAAFILTFFSLKSINFKNSILQRSNQAYINLNSVQENLSELNFFEAASSFALAARNFELILADLKKVGAVFSVLDKVTLGGVSGSANLIQAGELITQAGLDLAAALEKISGVNMISIIQKNESVNVLEILRQFRIHLIQASRSLNSAQALISDSDNGLIPESEKKKFEEFKLKLPELNGFIQKTIYYTDALMIMLGQSGPQRYLVLFQNSSEIRPTGGFPGSYALVEFDKGIMKEFLVDDIYNPDGQMKEKIIPPRPLQKITPNWGMRDANWFADFPASAKKIVEFYYKDTKILVDGVVALNVDLMPLILKVTGPVEMTDFGVTLDSENFLAEVQEEIEYVRTKGENQPKRILVEFAPKLLERLSVLSQGDWMKIFALLVEGVEKKNIQAYFVDGRLQKFAFENSFAGEIKEAAGSDYLMVVHSNIMGSKTDAVIGNKFQLAINDSEDGSTHTLEIIRSHKGGNFSFYNKKNNDYVRVLIPEGAEFLEITGNDSFDSNPLIDYKGQGFLSDPDLERYESRIKIVKGVEIFEESGKKAIAFWMIAEPKQTKTVKIKYKASAKSSGIYVQKQSGLKSEFKLTVNGGAIFDGNLDSDKKFEF